MIKVIRVTRDEVVVEGGNTNGGLKDDELRQAHTFATNIATLMSWGKFKHQRLSTEEGNDDIRD